MIRRRRAEVRGRGGTAARLAAWVDRDVAAVAVVVVLGLLAFSPWWAGGRVFAPLDLLDGFYQPWAGPSPRASAHNHFTSDAVTNFLVYRRIAEESFAEDGWIGWSDRTYGGRPEHANTMATYGDWTVQLHRYLGFWTAWHLGLLGQFLVAGLGMLVFLRSRGATPLVGALGAVAYGANSQFVLWIYHRWQLGAFAWVPWLVWSIGRYRAGRGWAWPLVPAFMALAFLGGNLQTCGFVALVIGAAWLGWGVRWSPRLRVDGRLTAHLAAWTALGVGLAAFTLVPEAFAYAETLEVGRLDRGGIGYRHGPVQPLLSALLIPVQAFPTLLGHPQSIDLAKALRLSLFDVAYFGFVPMLLAYRAALLRGAPSVARWLVALGLLIPLSPLVGPLYHRVQLLFVFGGVWAFAWYWERGDGSAPDPALRRAVAVVLGLVVLWVAASLATAALHDSLVARVQEGVARRVSAGRAGTLGFHRDWMLERARRLVSESRIWHPRQAVPAATALVGLGALWLRARGRFRPATVVLLASLAVELGAFAGGWVSVVDPVRHPAYVELPDIAAVRARVADGRVYVYRDADRPTIFFPSNTLAMYGIASIQQYETVTFPGMWHALGYAEDARSLGFLGVTHALSEPGRAVPDGWDPVYRGERLVLWENRFTLPRYAALRPGAAWPARPDLAPAGDPAALLAGRVRLLEAARNHRVIEAPAGATAVRVAENAYEGWSYRVNEGAWTPAGRAADGSLLLPLPPTKAPARVELVFRPRRRTLGRWLSGLALAALALGSALLAWRGRLTPIDATSTTRATRTPRESVPT